MTKTWAWDGNALSLVSATPEAVLDELREFSRRHLREEPDESQSRAWMDEVAVLQASFAHVLASNADVGQWHVILEYELPRERGRRPDVVVLAGHEILVLEFKGYEVPTLSHIDQVEAYARDLSEYHSASHGRNVRSVLVLTKAREEFPPVNQTAVATPATLASVLADDPLPASASPISPSEWLSADYAPLPSLVSAARMIFEHEPLPTIHRAESAGIPQALESLSSAALEAFERSEQHLAFVTGVPGAGKTLVGLQFVYTTHFSESEGERPAVFLSGNGPLVKVLQDTLRSKVFVQDVLGFLRRYGGKNLFLPDEHIWVFDEAQRAFDAQMALEKRGAAVSEPADFLGLGNRLNSWALMVGLIGEGQEINRGEEAGIGQWNDALEELPGNWIVHCPEHIAEYFTAAREVRISQDLNLDVSLRSHRAENLHEWVNALLRGDIGTAAKAASEAKREGFEMYVTRDPDAARLYVRDRYANEPDKRFGLLASAKAKNVAFYGFMNIFQFTSRMRLGPWFNAPATSSDSCCALRETATEFQVQGLELDMPILAWGDDLWWDGEWRSKRSTRSKMRDPHQIRLNAYRVLLTRGRDGLVVFVPNERPLDETYDALVRGGLNPMQRVWLGDSRSVLLPEGYRGH